MYFECGGEKLMCGICGKLVLDPESDNVDPRSLQRMIDTLRHRGPDEEGQYISSDIGLGHSRLKIIDLSTGQQPMSNEDGSIWVVFNGEIYNYKDLRAFLVSKGHKFRSATDTEVIVHLYEEYGEESVRKLWGMFAYALWDQKTKTLLLARDRVGIKPLYYAFTPTALFFASEVKAILSDSSVHVEPDAAAIDSFLTHLYVPGHRTPFKGVSKLLPGHYMVVKDSDHRTQQYWDLPFAKAKDTRTPGECSEQLTELLAQTMRDHMIADVPVGVLLSGGVDSTAMLSFALEHTEKDISTFTIGFDGQQCTDERPFAKLAARRYGTTHYDTTMTAKNFLDFLPRYVWHMEEPVCEPPAIALYYVSKLARQHVTVLISGEGGDEAFAGYQNYRNIFWLEAAKRVLGPLAGPMSGVIDGLGRLPGLGRVRKYAPFMTVPFEEYYYSRTANPFTLFNRFKDKLYTPDFRRQTLASSNGNGKGPTRFPQKTGSLGILDKMLYIDTKTWLPDDLLIKADRMTMANSLELRVPLLDHRVLEFAAALPRRYKLRGWTTKYLLKKALSERVPTEILRRRKTGFPVPYGAWIRNDINDTIRSILVDPRTVGRGYFQKGIVERMVDQNVRAEEFSKEIFSLVILELWHRVFIDAETVTLC